MTVTQGPRPGAGSGPGAHARSRDDRGRRRGLGRFLFDLVRGLLSLAVLLALLIGLPALLVVATTTLLPHRLPALDEVTKILTAPDDGSGFIAALAIIAWIAWLCFAISVVVEIPAQVRGLSAPRIRGLGWSQKAAGALIGGIMLLLPTGTALAAGQAQAAPQLADSVASAPSRVVEQEIPVRVQDPGPAAGPTHTVQRGDSLWTIAEERLGDGKRWTEIAKLNDGKVMANGQPFDSADYVEVGWVLALPANAAPPAEVKAAHAPETGPGDQRDDKKALPQTVTVKPGDTLSDIAEELLGDGDRYPEIFAANKDKPQPSGSTLTDPNAIEPGWTLSIPGAGGAETQQQPQQQPPRLPQQDPAGQQAPQQPQTPQQQPPAQQPKPFVETPPQIAKQDPITAPSAPAESSEAPKQKTENTNPTGSRAEAPSTGGDERSVPIGAIALGAVGAAAVLGALLVRRRLQQSVRRDGRRIAMPAPAAADLEQQLRATETPDALDLFDRTLRTLCARMSDTGRTLPLIDSVQLTDRRLELHLAAPSPPLYPFEAVHGDHMHWTCPADAELLHTSAAANVPAPYPALAVLGETDDGRQLLIDLESLGVVGLTDGSGEDNLAVLRALAVELLSNVWSDDLCVTVVGFGRELRDVEREGRQQLRYAYSLDEALGRLATWSDEVVGLLDDAKLTSPRQARTKGILPDTWPPEIVLSLEPLTEAHVPHIQRLTNTYPRAAAAIIAPIHSEPWLSGLGVTRLPTVPGVVTPSRINTDVHVQRLEDPQYQALVSMFTVSKDLDGVPADEVLIPGQRPDHEPEPVQVGAGAAGGSISSAAWSAVGGMERPARMGGGTATDVDVDAPPGYYQPDPTDPEPDERAFAAPAPNTGGRVGSGSWGAAVYPVTGRPLAPPERIERRVGSPEDTGSLPLPWLPDDPHDYDADQAEPAEHVHEPRLFQSSTIGSDGTDLAGQRTYSESTATAEPAIGGRPAAETGAEPAYPEQSYAEPPYAEPPYPHPPYGGEAPVPSSFEEPTVDGSVRTGAVYAEPDAREAVVVAPSHREVKAEDAAFGAAAPGTAVPDAADPADSTLGEPAFGAPVDVEQAAVRGPLVDERSVSDDGHDEIGLEGVDDPEDHPYASVEEAGRPADPAAAAEAPDEGTAVPIDARTNTGEQAPPRDVEDAPEGGYAAYPAHAANGHGGVRADVFGAPGVHVLGPDDEVDLMQGRERERTAPATTESGSALPKRAESAAGGVEMPSAEYWGAPGQVQEGLTAEDSGMFLVVAPDPEAAVPEAQEVGSTWDVAPPVAALPAEAPAASGQPSEGFAPTYPEIRILGQVDLIGVGEEVEHGRRARLTELAAWIALHPGRPLSELDAAVWPLGVTATARNSAISQLRRWVGTGQDGTSHLPAAVGGGGYAFGPGFACDWFRFRQLVAPGLYGSHEVAMDYARALDIVRDAPFDGVGPRRYVWAEPFRQQMIAEIVDVAARLADYHLDNHDPQSAKRACSVGLVVCPESQMLYRTMFRATHITGDRAELDYYVDRLDGLLAGLGAEPEPLTVELLRDLLDD
ncbi:LysM peptidoglycan-binding domain-containing protein [Embleya scabrispora]|uniref:LysM peptidoglycan-binding domain-containing protein n=1 Tax=Embleya scabrispora TaxID=159449 RepID=UPI0003A6B3F6|nr:LysM peptidoglycan-binding domain-containing protein [Embleya scabrispora]MYS84178.1 LysM peptidoglycan-binding domain-containing protein [Streptomyces sp. SID5474]